LPFPTFSLFGQFSTPDYTSQARFWPTQTKYPREDYAGAGACKNCHQQIFETQRETAMANTAMRAVHSAILTSHPRLSFSHGAYRYEITTTGEKSVYTVADDRNAASDNLLWAFGTGRVAQSFLFKRKDLDLYESRVTYFSQPDGLDFTPGRALASAGSLDEAMDRQVGRAEVYRCFSCHTTASGIDGSFDEDRLIPGVSCEACHGPGLNHVDAMQGLPARTSASSAEANTPARIFNPAKLTPEESVDFCGSCHGSYWDISLLNSSGTGNARYQPYRLEESKCWNKNDARLTCVACHDPHKEVETEASAYDHVCLSCHLSKPGEGVAVAADATHPGAACPVARKDCTSCHMPRVYFPVMHASFPDHRIRIVREGEPFPD
jgi:hypothetical protein